MDLLTVLICTFILLCIFYFGSGVLEIYHVRKKVAKLGLPGFQGLPLLGNSFVFRKMFGRAPGVPFSVYTLEALSGFRKALQEHDLFTATIGPFVYILLTRPDDVEVLLSSSKEISKSSDYSYLHPWLGTGLITSFPGKWKKQRRMLTPAFHFRILDEFQSVISDHSEVMINKLKYEVGKPFIDLERFLSSCALDIIASTALGVTVDAQKNADSAYCRALHDVSESVFTRMFSPWLWLDVVFWLVPEGRRMSKNLKVISSFIRKVIREKKELLLENKEDLSKYFEDNSDNKKIRRAFLEIMLIHNIINKDNQFSDQDIEDEVNTFTFAGHDTTSTGMVWTLYLLGRYQEIQAKAYHEIEEIFGDDTTRAITLEDIKKMNYLTAVIKESMRLFPPVPYLTRTLQEDFTIKNVTLPKGAILAISPPILHRDPRSYPNPEEFDPDHFLTGSKHPFSYIPFSAGPRNCIGQRFAMNEMKTVIASVLRNFKVTSLDPRDKVMPCSELVSRPHQPIRSKIELRATK